ncbi:MAG TPA: biotin carboxylase N-terminal domain-containing protein [Bdellovibrionales bacterium]|nr:biotin carboxylase N-terminal domain-containing protein [Bdellovibrionales bacterium]
MKITKLAIANRGEVAVRIIHACKELGIRTVLLHSDVDIGTRAWRMADEKVCIGPAPTASSYLNIEANVRGAVSAGAQAVHPGFGFLSENADFAQACIDAGLIFVGPKPETIRALGDKISAKKLIESAKVPTVPGYAGADQKVETLVAEAARIGFPVIVKAAAGGGGRGMKVIRSNEEAPELIASAQREAMSAFGSAIVFLEKYLDRAKHIEFQVFGDFTGKCVHLFERECSVQRRHQKIVEESLSPSLTQELRAQMGKAAVDLAEKAGYNGAGTVEFLVQDGKFYFLEMNTRLQVEHPVTEMVLGVDLVKAQILTAAKEFVVWKQADLIPRGHAIECRVYAEDSYNRGLPSTGELLALSFPEGPGRRFEVGFEAGDEVTSFYDPMIAKIIVWDENRERAIRKTLKVIDESVIFGVRTNLPYLRSILSHPEFISGKMTTQFIQTHFPEGLEAPAPEDWQTKFARAAMTELGQSSGGSVGTAVMAANPWTTGWRLV